MKINLLICCTFNSIDRHAASVCMRYLDPYEFTEITDHTISWIYDPNPWILIADTFTHHIFIYIYISE